MTSHVCLGGEGGSPKADKSPDKLCECDSDRGGVQNSENFADNHWKWPLSRFCSGSLKAHLKMAKKVYQIASLSFWRFGPCCKHHHFSSDHRTLSGKFSGCSRIQRQNAFLCRRWSAVRTWVLVYLNGFQRRFFLRMLWIVDLESFEFVCVHDLTLDRWCTWGWSSWGSLQSCRSTGNCHGNGETGEKPKWERTGAGERTNERQTEGGRKGEMWE